MPDERLKVAPPNYTQIPNVILDNMPRMSGQCFSVLMAVCRETFGWHKEKAPLSINDLAKLTGLSRQGVINGVTEGTYNGVLQRERVSGDHRDGFNYSIKVQDETAAPITWTPISAIQKAKKDTENAADSPTVNSVDYTQNSSVDCQLSSTLTVNSVDRHIRVKESIKESTPNGVRSAPQKIKPQKQKPAEFQPGSLVPLDDEFHIVLRRFCKCNGGATSKKQQEVEEAAAALLEHGATVEVLNRAYANYWKFRPTIAAHHKRSPTVAEVRDNFEDWAEISERPEAEKRMSEDERRIRYGMEITPERVSKSILSLMGGAPK